MIALGIPRRTPIGVSVNERFIKAAQLVRTPSGWRLASATCLPRISAGGPVDREEATRLRGVLARQRFKGRRLVLALPQDKLLSGVLDVPPRQQGAPLEQIVRGELAQLHGYDAGSAEVAFWSLPGKQVKEGTQVLAIACKHESAEALIDAFEGAGLDVAALDSSVHALARACRSMLSSDQITVILDLDWDLAALAVVCQGQIAYQRVMTDAGIGHLTKGLSDRLGLETEAADYILDDVGLACQGQEAEECSDLAAPIIRNHLDAICEELDAPLDYVARLCPGSKTEGILLTGHGAAIPGVAEYIHLRAGLDVHVVRPSQVVECPEGVGGRYDTPSLTATVGLCQFGE